MKRTAFFITFLTLASCDQYWEVSREASLTLSDVDCVKKSISHAPGVKSVMILQNGQSTGYTEEHSSPRPTVFQIKTDSQIGMVELTQGKVKVSFNGVGSSIPSDIAQKAPAELDVILKRIESTCGVSKNAIGI